MKRMLNPVTLSLKCFKVTVLCGAVLSLLGCVSATVQQVRERSCKPVDPHNDQRIAALDPFEHPREHRTRAIAA